MLEYSVNIKETSTEQVNISLATFTVVDYDDKSDNVMVNCVPLADKDRCFKGEEVSITNIVEYRNDSDDESETVDDLQSLTTNVYEHNEETGGFSLMVPKYREIDVTEIVEVKDDADDVYWMFSFSDGHFFKPEDVIEFDVMFEYGNYGSVHFSGVEYVDIKTLQWVYKEDVPNIDSLDDIIFKFGGDLNGKVSVRRSQTLFDQDYNHDYSDPPMISVVRPKLHIDIPISERFNTNLLHQISVDHDFKEAEINKVIPQFVDMEKIVYSPKIAVNSISGATTYSPVTKINFNLHFREHSGENWTVNETDGWNFTKYGYEMNDAYYSYPAGSESNQSDLLGYLGFNNNDVKYQKSRLQKSFLRLSFYDSPNVANQELLAYSTVFFNTSKLYMKFIRGQMLDDWYINERDTSVKYDKISVDFELDANGGNVPVYIKNSQEKVEEYRLSSQMSVCDKYSSNISSEGFYIYLWSDNKSEVPQNLYMKAEFNHAGYGRTIPMMMPYNLDGEKKFKTNEDIKNDWKKIGYGVKHYNEYAYLKLKYTYNDGQYIYYVDPEVYGNIGGGPIMNINLYEARIAF